MTELFARLRAALDQAQHLADQAGDGTWTADVCVVEGDRFTIYDEGWHSEEQAQHIAAWDPARVLRLIALHRSMLDRHEHTFGASIGCEPCTEVQAVGAFWLGEDTE